MIGLFAAVIRMPLSHAMVLLGVLSGLAVIGWVGDKLRKKEGE